MCIICNIKCTNFCRYIIMGLTMLICPFLPASNIFFNVGFVLAERVLYIPSAGYCLLVIIGLQKLSARFSLPKTLLLAYVILIILLFVRSWIRSNQWRNERLLFQSALDVCPLNAKVHYNIAKNAADAGNIDLAKLEYQKALQYCIQYARFSFF